MGRILIDKTLQYQRANWFDFRTIGSRRYVKDPVARAWVQVGKLTPNPPREPLLTEGFFIGPRGGRYRINRNGRKTYDVP